MSGDEAVTAATAAVTEPVVGHSSRLAKEQQQEKVMVHSIRVTEVIHPFSFFAQIGTGASAFERKGNLVYRNFCHAYNVLCLYPI